MISTNWVHAICRTMISMGPEYTTNVLKWVKSAVWDAPYRVWLDIELEKISIERNICNHPCEHTDEKDCDEKCHEIPKLD